MILDLTECADIQLAATTDTVEEQVVGCVAQLPDQGRTRGRTLGQWLACLGEVDVGSQVIERYLRTDGPGFIEERGTEGAVAETTAASDRILTISCFASWVCLTSQ